MPSQVIRTELPEFAVSVEIVVDDEHESIKHPISLEGLRADFAVVTLTSPNGQFPKAVPGHLEIETNSPPMSPNDENSYRDDTVIVRRLWENSGFLVRFDRAAMTAPVVINVLAFSAGGPPRKQLSRGSRLKCTGCKMTAKALALAIVAATALAATPAALIAAVAAYLGVASAVAAAFIGSVLDDTADQIAEKLCTKVGLCRHTDD
jgi:hypothetical protein